MAWILKFQIFRQFLKFDYVILPLFEIQIFELNEIFLWLIKVWSLLFAFRSNTFSDQKDDPRGELFTQNF